MPDTNVRYALWPTSCNVGSGCASDTSPGRRQGGETFETDGSTALCARQVLVGHQVRSHCRECVQVVDRLAEQGDGLSSFVGDRGTFGVMLVVGRRELSCLDEGRHGSLQGLDLAQRAVVGSVHDRQHTLDVDATH